MQSQYDILKIFFCWTVSLPVSYFWKLVVWWRSEFGNWKWDGSL